MTRLRFNSVNAVDTGEEIILNIKLSRKFSNAVQTILDAFNAVFEYEIKPYRQKRSLDANAYFWVIADSIAKVIKSDSKSVYRDLIGRVGVWDIVTFPALDGDEEKAINAMNRFKANWTKHGTGFLTKTLDKDKRIVQAFYGSSRYNTKEMSRLIDEAVKDAKELGIETKPQWEIDSMLKSWGESDGR